MNSNVFHQKTVLAAAIAAMAVSAGAQAQTVEEPDWANIQADESFNLDGNQTSTSFVKYDK